MEKEIKVEAIEEDKIFSEENITQCIQTLKDLFRKHGQYL